MQHLDCITERLAVSKPEFESVCKSVHEPELVAIIESKYIAYQRAQLIADRITDELTQCFAICFAFGIAVELPEYISVCIAVNVAVSVAIGKPEYVSDVIAIFVAVGIAVNVAFGITVERPETAAAQRHCSGGGRRRARAWGVRGAATAAADARPVAPRLRRDARVGRGDTRCDEREHDSRAGRCGIGGGE